MYKCTYNYYVEIEWDSNKATANLNEHGVNLADAVHVLGMKWQLRLLMIIIVKIDLLLLEWTHSAEFLLLFTLGVEIEFESFLQGRQLPRRKINIKGKIMKKEYDFKKGKKGPVIKTPKGKTRITIRLDDDILDWFRKHVHRSGGGNYQTLINMALREFMTSKRESLEETLRHVIREELSEYTKKSKR